jgi:OOP family OmpA-OmpF porin
MSHFHTTSRLGLIALAVAITWPAFADEDSGWYGGAAVGPTRAKIDDPKITSTLLGAGLTPTISDRNRDHGFKLFGGYQINRNFALEGSYFDLGQFGFTATTVPPGSLRGDIRLKGLALDGLGILPLASGFSVFGRLGLNYAQARDQFATTGAVSLANLNPSKSQVNWKYGVGLMYALNESLSIRLETERYRVNDAVGNRGHVDLVSLGLLYRFGAHSPAVVPRAMAAEPVVMAAAPAPVPVVVAPPPAPAPAVVVVPVSVALRKVSFSADSLFDFDRSTVKPAGKLALDKFAAELKGLQYDTISVTGHTDRIGSQAYNQKLSSRRAEAVSAYLVESAGIAASRIEARGVDGSLPLTKPGECVGNKATAQLIACLQPDRRVEVQVTGMR